MADDLIEQLEDNLVSLQGVGGGPKPVAIGETEVRLMAMIMCPVGDIAAFYGFSERQLYRRFAQSPELRTAFAQGRAQGRRMLRQKQFTVAIKEGDVQMLKWLGQNVLGQSSRHSIKSDDLKAQEMDGAIDVEFEEVFDALDEQLRADGFEIPEIGDAGNVVLEPDDGQGQSDPANPKSAD